MCTWSNGGQKCSKRREKKEGGGGSSLSLQQGRVYQYNWRVGSVQRNHHAGQYTGEEEEEEEEEEDLICFPLRFGGASIEEEGGEIRNGDTGRKEDFDKCEGEGENRQVLKLFLRRHSPH